MMIIIFVLILIANFALFLYGLKSAENADDLECKFHISEKRETDLVRKVNGLGSSEKLELKRSDLKNKLDEERETYKKIEKKFKRMIIIRRIVQVLQLLLAGFTLLFILALKTDG